MTPYSKLSTFCVAARQRSFQVAAEELNLTPSAVSHQMRALEAQLRVQLFERRTRKVDLTLAGARLLQGIEKHLEAVDDAVASTRAKPDAELVHIKLPEFFASELFIPAVSEFSALHTDIELRIETTRLGIDTAPDADLAVVLSSERPNFAEVQALFPIAVAPACAEQNSSVGCDMNKGWLKTATLLVHEARPDGWQRWALAAGMGQLDPKQVIRFDSMLSLLTATERGLGVGLLPMPLSQTAFSAGRVRRVSDIDYVTQDYYYLVAAKHMSTGARQLMQWICARFAQNA